MAEGEMFASAIRSNGDFSGVFEYDEDVGYFYLYEVKGATGQKIAAAIRVLTETPDFEEKDVEIRWNDSQLMVGLFIRGQIWAVFDAMTGDKYGGNYRSGDRTAVPSDVAASFQ